MKEKKKKLTALEVSIQWGCYWAAVAAAAGATDGNRSSLASIIQGCRLDDKNRVWTAKEEGDNGDARSPNDNNARPGHHWRKRCDY